MPVLYTTCPPSCAGGGQAGCCLRLFLAALHDIAMVRMQVMMGGLADYLAALNCGQELQHREAAREKSGLILELSQRGGGGVKVQSKVKGGLFATNRFPLGSLSPYLTSMMVLHFSYLINFTLEPSLYWVIKKIYIYIKNVDLKSAPR